MKAFEQTSHYVNLWGCMSIYKLLHLTECLTSQLFSNCIVLQSAHIVLHTHTHIHTPSSLIHGVTCWSSLVWSLSLISVENKF